MWEKLVCKVSIDPHRSQCVIPSHTDFHHTHNSLKTCGETVTEAVLVGIVKEMKEFNYFRVFRESKLFFSKTVKSMGLSSRIYSLH